MSHEQEYIEIFDHNRELIEEPCATLLNAARGRAAVQFRSMGFPGIKEENWLHSNVAKRFATDFGMNLGRVEVKTDMQSIFTCDVPNLKTHQAFIINDTFRNSTGGKELPEGVILASLNETAEKYPTMLQPYYDALAVNGDNIAQFNTMFAQDGMVLYVPKNCVIDETIQVVTLLQSNVEMLSNRRLLVILEENSSASLLICDHSSMEKQTLSTQVMEVFLGRGAQFNLYELEETSHSNTRLGHLYVRQQADSSFNHSNITLTNGFTRNYINVSLEGHGAETNICGLAIGDKEQHIDNHTLVDHKTGNCNSNELYKYILDEHSTGVFAGKMLIRPDAQHTNSQQTNRNLCLTNDAHMYAQPQLEIYADDVKCSHGSTVGQLDENALFYMRQRGIPAEEACHLLMFAFAGEVIDAIKLDALKERLHILVEKRFRGELNRCQGCSLCK